MSENAYITDDPPEDDSLELFNGLARLCVEGLDADAAVIRAFGTDKRTIGSFAKNDELSRAMMRWLTYPELVNGMLFPTATVVSANEICQVTVLHSSEVVFSEKQRAFLHGAAEQAALQLRQSRYMTATERRLSLGEDYRKLFQSHPLPLLLYDRASERIMDANVAACRQYGATREKLLSCSMSDLRAPQSDNPLDAAYEPVFLPILQRQVEEHVRAHSDTIRIEMHTSDVTVDSEQCVLAVAHNITGRIQSEVMLSASEARFRGIIEHAGDLIMLLDRDCIICYANQAATSLLGFDPNDMIGARLLDKVHPDDLERVIVDLQHILSMPNDAPPLNLRLETTNGQWRNVGLTCRNLLDTREIQAIVVSCRPSVRC